MTNSDKIGLVIIITSVACVASVVFLFIKVFSLEHEINSLKFISSEQTNNLAADFSNLTTNSSNSTNQTSTTATDRDASRKTDLATIAAALEQYKSAKGSYPISSTITKLDSASSDVALKLSPYLSAIPKDPLDPQFYYGYLSENGTGYLLTAVLENKQDAEAVQSGSLALYKIEKTGSVQTPTVPDTSTSNSSNNTSTNSDDSSLNAETDTNTDFDTNIDNSSDDSYDEFTE